MVVSVPEGPIALVSVRSGKVLEVAEGAGGGAVVVQATDQGEERQRWQLILAADDSEDSYYRIMNLHSGLVLEVGYESLEDGAEVFQRAYPEDRQASHRQWQLVFVDEESRTCQIMNRNSGKALDVEGGETEASTKEGVRVIQWTYWGGTNQRWRLIPAPPGDRPNAPDCAMRDTAAAPVLEMSKALSLMRPIFGWFDEGEAELLLATASRALRELPDDCAVVEVGSYLGRSTVLLASAVRDLRPCGRVVAIDPHEGAVSVSGQPNAHGLSTYDAFCRNLIAAGVRNVVREICQRSTDVLWEQPIGLLFVDGLHDYDNVRADFGHFERWIVPGGFVAFHDYVDYWPGVVQLVDEERHGCEYAWVDSAGSLAVLQKRQR